MRLLPALALCGASLFSSWLGAVQLTSGTPDYGVLIISRERLEIATACDIGVYLQDQLVSRLFQGQSASYNLPPGEVSVRLGIMGDTGCQPSFEQIRSDRVQIRAGAIHKYRVMLLESGLGLRAVDP